MPDGSGNAQIEFLRFWKPGLEIVPGWDPDNPAWRDEYFTWREDLEPVRRKNHDLCKKDKGARANELALCAADYKYWLTMWAKVYEPRPRKDRITGKFESRHKPFTPFAFQCHTADWIREVEQREEAYDVYITKSRGIGLSWTAVAETVWAWMWGETTTLLMSRTQSEVDKPNNMNTLFGKAVYLLRQLPPWMLPEGFDIDVHRTQLNIFNPVNFAQIYGETTTGDVGIGDRAQKGIIDEAASIRELNDVQTSLSGTTDHLVHISTESIKYGFTWERKWKTSQKMDPNSVMVLEHYLNPYQDEQWLEQTRERFEKNHDIAGFYAQILRNPKFGNTGIVYPEAEQVAFSTEGYDPSLPVFGSIDPGMTDDTAIVWAQPTDGALSGRGPLRFIDSYERNLVPAEYYAHILTGIEPQPGDVCHGLHFGNRERQIMAWTATLPWGNRTRYFMDPAGIQKDTSGKSFYLRIIQESKRLRVRWIEQQIKAGKPQEDLPAPRAIAPIYKELFNHRNHQARQNAARPVLARSVFATNPGCRRLVEALQEYRFTELTAKATSEAKPIHDDNSHLVAAFEYLAVYAEAGIARIPRQDDGNEFQARGGVQMMVA